MRDSEVFAQAAQEINNRGWCRNLLMDKDGHVCLIGAVMCAAQSEEHPAHGFAGVRYTDEANRLVSALNQYMAHVLELDVTETYFEGCVSESPAHWNNNVARDADEVVHVLKLAAEHFAISEELAAAPA